MKSEPTDRRAEGSAAWLKSHKAALTVSLGLSSSSCSPPRALESRHGSNGTAAKTVMVLPRTDRGIDRTIGMTTSVRASMGRTMVRSSRTMTWVADDAPPPKPSWLSPDLIGGSTGPSA